MAETKKTTKTAPKAETKKAASAQAEVKTEATEPKAEAKPKAAAKPKTAPKAAAKPKSAAKPKTAPKSAPKAEKTAEPKAPATSTAGSAAQMPNDFAKMVVNQLIEAQRMWLEMTTQQTAIIFKTVSEVMGMSQNAPTEALAKWTKQGVESFIAAQKQWSEIALQQSAQLMQTVQSGANFGSGGMDALGAAQGAAGKGLEILVNMREAWLDFAAQQNAQMVKSLKQNLKLDDSSPVAAIADFAQQTMTSYVEIQKRWLDMATQIPLFGSAKKDKS
ncbi:MAG TPA: hypothetical protein VNB22_12665 [Pyrinomonadaceae bacterium]|nr:hypothetical protein [Pyrinomonadaceae bacterium]